MADIVVDMGSIAVPTPEPPDKNFPERQRETSAFVLNQIFAQMSQNAVKIAIPDVVPVTGDQDGTMAGVEDAIRDLLATSYEVKIGPLRFVKHGTAGLVSIEEG